MPVSLTAVARWRNVYDSSLDPPGTVAALRFAKGRTNLFGKNWCRRSFLFDRTLRGSSIETEERQHIPTSSALISKLRFYCRLLVSGISIDCAATRWGSSDFVGSRTLRLIVNSVQMVWHVKNSFDVSLIGLRF